MIEFSLKEGDRLQITGLRALIEIIVQLGELGWPSSGHAGRTRRHR